MISLCDCIIERKDLKRTAIYYLNKKISFRDFYVNICKMSDFFYSLGIKQGDVVTLALPNIPTSLYALFALDAIGATQNIIHPLTKFNEINRLMDQTHSKYVLMLINEYQACDNDKTYILANPYADDWKIKAAAVNLKFKKNNANVKYLDDLKKQPFKELVINSRQENETSIYLHSGGTTGLSKIIELSDEAILNLCGKVDHIISGDLTGKSMFAVLPMFHGFGLAMGIMAALTNNGSVSLMMKFNVKKTIKWINEGKIQVMIGVPLLYQKLMSDPNFAKAKLDNLEFCFVGGDVVSENLVREFNALMASKHSGCLMLEGYGLTETIAVASVNTKENNKVGTLGKPLINNEIIILDQDKILSPLEVGEIAVATNTLMNGYYEDKELTSKVIFEYDGKKFLKTGDLGYLDEEGYLVFKGRKKRMFKISGINVYPNEIEQCVMNLEPVFAAALKFFPTPKAHTILYVVKDRNCTKKEAQIKEEIYASLKDKYLKYAWPRDIVFLSSFLKTKVHKVDYSQLKDVE